MIFMLKGNMTHAHKSVGEPGSGDPIQQVKAIASGGGIPPTYEWKGTSDTAQFGARVMYDAHCFGVDP